MPRVSREGDAAGSAWRRWKRFWRGVETSGPLRRAKRLVRQLVGTELRYFPQLRLPKERFGDWWLSPEGLSSSSVVYSLGVGEDVGFDVGLIERWAVPVHAFDPTPAAVEWVRSRDLPRRFHFHPVGISDFDGVAEFHPPAAEGSACYSLVEREDGARTGAIIAEVRRLTTIMEELGHDRIDLLKMDIEGAEYTVLPDLIRSGVSVGQVLVEFHHRFPGVGNERTRQMVELLLANGFRILHISPSGREYAFLYRGSPEPPGA